MPFLPINTLRVNPRHAELTAAYARRLRRLAEFHRADEAAARRHGQTARAERCRQMAERVEAALAAVEVQ
jgi:hypothetical protein